MYTLLFGTNTIFGALTSLSILAGPSWMELIGWMLASSVALVVIALGVWAFWKLIGWLIYLFTQLGIAKTVFLFIAIIVAINILEAYVAPVGIRRALRFGPNIYNIVMEEVGAPDDLMFDAISPLPGPGGETPKPTNAPSLEPGRYVVVTGPDCKDNATLREKRTNTSKVLANLPNGTEVETVSPHFVESNCIGGVCLRARVQPVPNGYFFPIGWVHAVCLGPVP